MKTIDINIKMTECSKSELAPEDLALVESAEKFVSHSYSPYSKFSVSAAIRLSDGTIVNGTNQENAAYPSGLCAERTAMFFANSQYPGKAIKTLAITAFTNGDFLDTPITPCGACRQALLESEQRFSTPIKIILAAKDRCFIVNSISDLLPLSFGSEFLK